MAFPHRILQKLNRKKFNVVEKKEMRKPGIEPGAQRWQRWILPLNHLRLMF